MHDLKPWLLKVNTLEFNAQADIIIKWTHRQEIWTGILYPQR
jgi:hypothetical protein